MEKILTIKQGSICWAAWLDSDPDKYCHGSSEAEAVGLLVIKYQDELEIEVK